MVRKLSRKDPLIFVGDAVLESLDKCIGMSVYKAT
jgi:hypothetical protein